MAKFLAEIALNFRSNGKTFAKFFKTNRRGMAEAAAETFDESTSRCNSNIVPLFSWKRTSLAILAFIEQKIFSSLKQPFEGHYVSICNGQKRIWTISMNTNSPNTPLVMLHGMGSGVGLWVLNLDSLSKNRPVYAIDVLGFGRSSRSKFSTDPEQAEQEFIDSVEEWRSAMDLGKIILLGHSLGGYLSACYAMQHPQHIKHIILVDPWGLPERPSNQDLKRDIPVWVRVIGAVIEPFNPFAPLRALGPWGPSIVAKIRSDLIRKYEHLYPDTRIAEYIYHCNAQHPSGEAAFKSLMHQFGWAKRPILPRINKIPAELSMTLIHGQRSWVDYSVGFQIKFQRTDSFVNVEVIKGAGHHVYADKPELFNEYVNRACDWSDQSDNSTQWFSPPIADLQRSASLGFDAKPNQLRKLPSQRKTEPDEADGLTVVDCNANAVISETSAF